MHNRRQEWLRILLFSVIEVSPGSREKRTMVALLIRVDGCFTLKERLTILTFRGSAGLAGRFLKRLQGLSRFSGMLQSPLSFDSR